MMGSNDRVEELEARVAELTQRVERLTATAPTAEVVEVAATSSRRNLLKLAGAVTVGAAASIAAGVNRVAADDPNDLTLGTTKATAGLTQARLNTGVPGGRLRTAFFFQVGQVANHVNDDGLAFPSALAGRTSTSDAPPGVFGSTNVSSGYGVVGAISDVLGTGVHGAGGTGVDGTGTGIGVNGTGGAFGVRGAGPTGVLAVGGALGVNGMSPLRPASA